MGKASLFATGSRTDFAEEFDALEVDLRIDFVPVEVEDLLDVEGDFWGLTEDALAEMAEGKEERRMFGERDEGDVGGCEERGAGFWIALGFSYV